MKKRSSAENRKRPVDPFFEVEQVVSSTECTGLMRSMPEDEEEQENLAELYSIHDRP